MNSTDRRILIVAAGHITDGAKALKDGHTIKGRWPASEAKTCSLYHEQMWCAAQLRLIAKRKGGK